MTEEIDTNECIRRLNDLCDKNPNFFKNWDRRHKDADRRVRRAHRRFSAMSDEEFQAFINKQIALHGEAWKDVCYKKKKCMPYPKRDLRMLFNVAKTFGMTKKNPHQSFFMAEAYTYRGFDFESIHGQGRIDVIWKRNERILQVG